MPKQMLPNSILLLVLSGTLSFAADETPQPTEARATAEQIRFFESKVRPLLAARCHKCHGPKVQENGLRLDSPAAVRDGSESGPVVVPGNPDESLLVSAVKYELLEMPPDGKLDPREIEILTRWVKMGVPWPDRHIPVERTDAGALFSDEDREFWSFQPIRDPRVPQVTGDTWSLGAIDRFVLRRLRREGLTPAPEADRRTLLRRAYFDLIGLPPTPQEVDAFLAEQSPTAYEEMIDRLLASPRYGERWGRHWLDLVRYAESDGHGSDAYRPDAWRYRDYVVESFNNGKPYDRFVTEQLAGDEIAPDDPDALVATGFLRHWIYESNQRKIRQVLEIILNDLTDVTGEVFLGLGFGCARCHDHKFDPILQKDYYRLQAFFAPLVPVDDSPEHVRAAETQYAEQRSTWEALTADIRSQIDEIEAPYREAEATKAFKMFPQEIKDIYRMPAAERTAREQQFVALVDRQLDSVRVKIDGKMDESDLERRDALIEQLAKFDSYKPAPLSTAMMVTDIGPSAPPTTLPGSAEVVQPGYLSLLDDSPAKIGPVSGVPTSTGRRATLARWITSPSNPLTARVIVNRIWQYHFGTGLVATSSDFGRLGTPPTHPELLDWLARRFVRDGWSFKEMHRLIMNSATYRQLAVHAGSETARLKDPSNRLLWRMNIRRLDAEQIRDATLAVTGELEFRMGGESIEPSVPRRTIYMKVIRNAPSAMMQAFDAPDGFISTARRQVTTTPTQALLLVNSRWTNERAGAMRERLVDAGFTDDDEFVSEAYRLALARRPDPVELAISSAFLRSQSARVSTDVGQSTSIEDRRQEVLTDFCHALLNSNEFVYVD